MTSRKHFGSSSAISSRLAGLIALAIVSCGMSGLAAAHGTIQRGQLVTVGPSTKVVAVGPVELHAYSEFAGGALYTARVVTGTDRDCQAPVAATAIIPADRVTNFTANEGDVICLATTTHGSFELLWHAVAQPVSAPMLVAKAKR